MKKTILVHELNKLEADMLNFFLISQTKDLKPHIARATKKDLVTKLKLFWHTGVKPGFKIPELLLKPNITIKKMQMSESGIVRYGIDNKIVSIENIPFIIAYQHYDPFKVQRG